MRPTGLEYPFVNKAKKHVFIEDRVWYIPEKGVENYQSFRFPGWQAIFGNDNPVMVEYCSGNGAWIAAKAQSEPGLNWIAVEKRFDRVKKIWSKKCNLGLTNLLIVYGEGLFTSRNYFPDQSITGIYVNFPDPWPKRRHARFRLIASPFIKELHRCLSTQGMITLVTDDEKYSQSIIRDFSKESEFASVFPEPFFTHELAEYGTSYFEELWRNQGLVIRYHQFTKLH